MTKPGILALWQDCAAGRETDLERWYQTEHLAERLGVPGFRRGRRYEAVEARQRYFTYYETDTPEVLISPAYRERLDNPSPLTREIMSNVMANMSRTICTQERRAGAFRGAHACAVKLTSDAEMAGPFDRIATMPGLARVELWASAKDIAPPATEEERLRGGDTRIAACLLVETLRAAEARAVAEAIRAEFGERVVEIGLYQLLCELEKT